MEYFYEHVEKAGAILKDFIRRDERSMVRLSSLPIDSADTFSVTDGYLSRNRGGNEPSWLDFA